MPVLTVTCLILFAAVTACDATPCKHDGLCFTNNLQAGDNGFFCRCNEPYINPNCEEGKMKQKSCGIFKHFIKCQQKLLIYAKLCTLDYILLVDPVSKEGSGVCALGMICQNGATCINTNIAQPAYRCSCPPGFVGQTCNIGES